MQHTRYLDFSIRGCHRKENQDRFTARTNENDPARSADRGELFAVADGLGGHRAGGEAARETIDRLFQLFYDPGTKKDDVPLEQALGNLFHEINKGMEQKGNNDPSCKGWGCTLSALAMLDRTCFFAHTGDTRIYRLRNGKSDLLTEDQNVAFQMYKFKQIDYNEYLEGSGHGKLLSYVGLGHGISVQTGTGDVMEGDVFVICSDGLNQFVQIRDMERLAGELKDFSGDRLARLYDIFASELIRPEEAKDDVTFILISRSV